MAMDKKKNTHKECKQIIITGATGFIGQHLIPIFIDHGYEVIAIARDLVKAQKFSWFGDVQFISHDLQKETPDFCLKEGSGLIHLAWQGLPNYKSLFHFEENLPQSYNFIKSILSQGVKTVLVTGTCFEYGFQSGAISSSAETCPRNPYALAKDSLRKHLEFLAKEQPFTLQWARLFYMYGKGQNPRSVLSQLDSSIENGDSTFKMSGGEQLRDYLPVEEVAQQLFDLYSERAAGTYNICSGKPISVRRLVEERIAQQQSKIEPILGHYPYPDYEPMAFWGVRDIGQTIRLPSLPNAPLSSKVSKQLMAPMRLRYQPELRLLENEAFDPTLIDYSDNYENSQAHSQKFSDHMGAVLKLLKQQLPQGGQLVEVGCGKGAFVELAEKDGHFQVSGFDAAYEGDNSAIEKRYLTIQDRIHADIVVLRHVLEHIQNPYRFLSMLSVIFGDAKVYIEVPDYDWIINNGAFFDITYEHVNYFSRNTLTKLFKNGCSINELCFEGQYQYIISDFQSLDPAFEMLYQSSHWHYETLESLFPNIHRLIERIESTVQGKSLFIWGAATKGCLFLAYCAAQNRLIKQVKFAIDINPDKIGKFLPGSLVEIRSKTAFFGTAKQGDVLLVSNPAYLEEIKRELESANVNGVRIETL
jgi:dTDP-6-deoxy-L-talose 4-dehydrogenase (NAD+)